MATIKRVVESNDVLKLTLTASRSALTGALSGDYVTGVTLRKTDADNKAPILTRGVVLLQCSAVGNAGASPISIGSKLYYDGGEINRDSVNGTWFGTALEALGGGLSGSIRVLLAPR